MKRATLPATAALVALTVFAARADDPAATAPADPGAGNPTSAGQSPGRSPSSGRKDGATFEESANFGWSLDWGVGSGAGSVGMRGQGK